MTPWRTRLDLPRLAVLAIVAVAVWVTATGRWSTAAWQTPAAYSVDALETLARFQISHEHGASLLTHPRAERLGAPDGADWTGYPLPDFPWYWLAGKLVGSLGLIPASNAMLLLAHLLSVLVFFACARVLGQRPLFAAGAALLFGFCFSIFHRGLSHHSFALAFTVPPVWLAVWLVAGSRRLIARPAGAVLCLGTGVLVGWSNPYFIYLFGVLLLLALAVQSWRSRRRANLVVGVATGVTCVATFALANLPFLQASAAGLYARSEQSALYGLRLLDLIAPPATHHLAWAGELGRSYAAGRGGEPFSPYLGLVAAAGLLLALSTALIRLVRRRPPTPAACWALAVLAFALAGGVNSWLAALGLDQFRASNRYSIHLLALGLCFLAGWSAHVTRGWAPLVRVALVGGVGLVGLWDSIPRATRREHQLELRGTFEHDQRVGRALEAALPPGTAVFQLPVAVFPEQGPLGAMGDYELLRLLLTTHTLRFSYGGLSNAPDFRWQRNVARQPTRDLVAALEQAGFGALHLNRDGFTDRAAALAAELDALGLTRVIDDGAYLIYRLNAAAEPRPPGLDDPLALIRWDEHVPRRREPAVFAGAGWFALEQDGDRTWRWAGPIAEVPLFNEFDVPRAVRLRFTVTATTSAFFALEQQRELQRTFLRADHPRELEVTFALQPGMNTARFVLAGPPRRAGPKDPRQIAFSVTNLHAEFLLPAAP
jgi:phosphoglycerol transferase